MCDSSDRAVIQVLGDRLAIANSLSHIREERIALLQQLIGQQEELMEQLKKEVMLLEDTVGRVEEENRQLKEKLKQENNNARN